MSLAMLLLSAISGAVSAALVWMHAGFWWAFAAYSATGAATLLLLAGLYSVSVATKKPACSQNFPKAQAAG